LDERAKSFAEDAFDDSPVGVLILDAKLGVVWLSNTIERFFGLTREDALGKHVRTVIREKMRCALVDPEEFEARVLGSYNHNTPVEHFECAVKPGENREARRLEYFGKPLTRGVYAGGRIEQYHDVTRLKRVEARLRESEEKYRNLVEMSPDGVMAQIGDRIVFANAALAAILGAPNPESLIGRKALDFFPPGRRAWAERRMGKLLEERKSLGSIQQTLVRLDGRSVTVEAAAAPITFEGVPAYQAVVRDISARKRTEALLMDSLKEKDALLREIHHRVKNNLAVIGSLLNLQAAALPEGVSREVLSQMQVRLQSIALAHEVLYQSENLARLDIRRYMSRLIDNIADSVGTIGTIRRIDKDIDPLDLSLDEAAPLGFIVTELVSNAMKHAFPKQREGRVRVSLKPAGKDEAVLVVSDDGVGLPDDFDPGASPSLGFKLVSIFVKQLHAQMGVSRDDGVTVSIRMKIRGTQGGVS
jgi:PAS domain S-box-containing protein